jgi:hypothetical protein
VGEERGVSGGMFEHRTHEEDGPETWETSLYLHRSSEPPGDFLLLPVSVFTPTREAQKSFSQLFLKGKVKSTPISGATSGAFFVTPKPLLSFSTTFLLRKYCTSPIICASP